MTASKFQWFPRNQQKTTKGNILAKYNHKVKYF